MNATFFKNKTDLRDWLSKNHQNQIELWLGYYKKKSLKYNYSWSESVDELICFGWIDGLRKSIDDERYMIRITPRKPISNWSAVNIEKANNLIETSKMQKAGLIAFNLRLEKKSKVYSIEQKNSKLSEEFKHVFKKELKAWQFYNSLSPSTIKQCNLWIMSAKKEETKLKRLNILMEHSSKKEKIPQLQWTKKKPL
jgi:uncharacterized protein YdeI (YjbR/CyaY-like superfamily)